MCNRIQKHFLLFQCNELKNHEIDSSKSLKCKLQKEVKLMDNNNVEAKTTQYR